MTTENESTDRTHVLEMTPEESAWAFFALQETLIKLNDLRDRAEYVGDLYSVNVQTATEGIEALNHLACRLLLVQRRFDDLLKISRKAAGKFIDNQSAAL